MSRQAVRGRSGLGVDDDATSGSKCMSVVPDAMRIGVQHVGGMRVHEWSERSRQEIYAA